MSDFYLREKKRKESIRKGGNIERNIMWGQDEKTVVNEILVEIMKQVEYSKNPQALLVSK